MKKGSGALAPRRSMRASASAVLAYAAPAARAALLGASFASNAWMPNGRGASRRAGLRSLADLFHHPPRRPPELVWAFTSNVTLPEATFAALWTASAGAIAAVVLRIRGAFLEVDDQGPDSSSPPSAE